LDEQYGQDPRIKSAEGTTNYSQGFINQSDPDLIKHLLDSNPVLQELQLGWLGIIQNQKGQLVSIGSPRMNLLGVITIVKKINELLNHFVSMGNITEDQQYEFTETIVQETTSLLFFEEDNYELNTAYRDSIINSVARLSFIGLSRAKNQGEKVFLSKTHESKQLFQEREKQKKGVRSIFPW